MDATIPLPNSLSDIHQLLQASIQQNDQIGKSIALGAFAILLSVTVKTENLTLFRLCLREIGSVLDDKEGKWVLQITQKYLDAKSKAWLDAAIKKVMHGVEEDSE